MRKKDLRVFVEDVVKASPAYLEKEKIRELLQNIVVSRVRDGSVSDDSDLKQLFDTMAMASRALRGIPFEVYKKISK